MAIPGKNADLIRRFKLYGFGFLMGILVVSFVYKGKGCQLPSSAKIEELRWQKTDYTTKANCQMACSKITDTEVKELLGIGATKGKGKVNYDESNVHQKPYPTYAIEGITTSGKNLRIVIADIDTVSSVLATIDLNIKNDSCNCK